MLVSLVHWPKFGKKKKSLILVQSRGKQSGRVAICLKNCNKAAGTFKYRTLFIVSKYKYRNVCLSSFLELTLGRNWGSHSVLIFFFKGYLGHSAAAPYMPPAMPQVPSIQQYSLPSDQPAPLHSLPPNVSVPPNGQAPQPPYMR